MDVPAVSPRLAAGAILTQLARRPVRPPRLDYDPADYQIRPCEKCNSWWAEIVRDPAGHQVVREWHSPTCSVLTEIEWD